MPFTTDTRNSMLGDAALGITTGTVHVSLHGADPGETGANEMAGGDYARVAGTLAAAADGARALSADVTLDVPAGATVTHVGYWTAATGGTFIGSDDVTAETFASAGTYTVTAAGTTFTVA